MKNINDLSAGEKIVYATEDRRKNRSSKISAILELAKIEARDAYISGKVLLTQKLYIDRIEYIATGRKVRENEIDLNIRRSYYTRLDATSEEG